MHRIVAMMAGSAVGLVMMALPTSASHYYPHLAGPPAGRADGVLIAFGRGNASGTVMIRQLGNPKRFFYLAAPPFIVDGKPINCTSAPEGRYSPPPDLCRAWPPSLKIGSTRVRVFFWRGIRNGKRTEVTRELRILR